MKMLAKPYVVALLVLLGLSGTALAKEFVYSGAPYEHHKITVQAEKILLKGEKIWFKLVVINGTDKLLVFDKEQIQARTPDGRVLPRERSVFAGTAKPSEVAPGLSKPLWVEYKIGAVPVEVALLFKRGFILAGRPIELPDYVAEPVGAK